MKKRTALLLALALILSLCACTSGGTSKSAPGTASAPPQGVTAMPVSEPTPAPTPEPTPEPEATPALPSILAYAGNLDESVWHFYETTPSDARFQYIGIFYFSETGEFGLITGYASSEADFAGSGSYTCSDAGELRFEAAEYDVLVSATYAVDVLDPDTLLLTQTSEQGVFYYHSAGHQILLEKGFN